ncbi:MAG: BufA1 family periplasmic bufferin-type metallophore [Chromatiales bacterium]
MKTKYVVTSALASVLALGLAASSNAATEDHSKDEKCAGVIKAGKNDCSTSRNACHSHVTVDGDPEAWIWVPKGTCEKIVGARLSSIKSPDEK